MSDVVMDLIYVFATIGVVIWISVTFYYNLLKDKLKFLKKKKKTEENENGKKQEPSAGNIKVP